MIHTPSEKYKSSIIKSFFLSIYIGRVYRYKVNANRDDVEGKIGIKRRRNIQRARKSIEEENFMLFGNKRKEK